MSSDFGQGLDKCVKCSICVEHCPVFRVESSFPGPKQCGPDSQRFRHHRETWLEPWLAACSHCTLCETACPSGVPIAEMIMAAQNRLTLRKGKKPVNRILALPSLIGKLASPLSFMVNPVMRLRLTRKFMQLMLGIDAHLPFPAYSNRPFRRSAPRQSDEGQVLFFHGCTIKYNQPDIGSIIIELLERLGIEVIIPVQDCCGLPRLCNADERGAARNARRQIDEFSRHDRQSLPVIYSCTSCGHTLAHEWSHLTGNSADFQQFANRLFNIHEFISERLERTGSHFTFKHNTMKLAYHIPCHLRSLGIGYPAVRMLRSLPGLDVHVLNTGCCGLSGTYGYKPGHGDISRKIGEEVAGVIKRLKPDMIVTDCGSCRLQLESLTGIPARDPLEIIHRQLMQS